MNKCITLNFPPIGIISGALTLRSRDCIESRYSNKLGPSHQGHTFLLIRSFKLCPLYAEIGMKKRSVLGLNPFPFKNVPSRFVHSSNLSSAQYQEERHTSLYSIQQSDHPFY